jgi:hypothetical protein
MRLEEKRMKPRKPDPEPHKNEMISLFVILGLLTMVVAMVIKVVLFSPVPQLVEMATK